ncbi:MAG: T9SS type A sorting domain-containing protein [Bacteroidia bacterium]|nr:T9SS type A sorting domain-containing protein [Bacteroidia bacterium]
MVISVEIVRYYFLPPNNLPTHFFEYSFGLYDIQGRLLLSRELRSEKETLSLGNLPEGLYIWRVENLIHGGYETGKLVIQR